MRIYIQIFLSLQTKARRYQGDRIIIYWLNNIILQSTEAYLFKKEFYKKLIIPSIFLALSIAGCIYINDNIVNHTDKLISYSNDKNAVITQTDKSVSHNSYKVSKDNNEIATVTISKKVLSLSDFIKILLILNIPTVLFTTCIITGNKFKINSDEVVENSLQQIKVSL